MASPVCTQYLYNSVLTCELPGILCAIAHGGPDAPRPSTFIQVISYPLTHNANLSVTPTKNANLSLTPLPRTPPASYPPTQNANMFLTPYPGCQPVSFAPTYNAP